MPKKAKKPAKRKPTKAEKLSIQRSAEERKEVLALLEEYENELASLEEKKKEAEDRLRRAEEDLDLEFVKLKDEKEHWKKLSALRAEEILHDYQYETLPHGTGGFFSLKFDRFRKDAPIFTLTLFAILDKDKTVSEHGIPKEKLEKVGNLFKRTLREGEKPLFPFEGRPLVPGTEIRPEGKLETEELEDSRRICIKTRFDLYFPQMEEEKDVEKMVNKLKKMVKQLENRIGTPPETI